MVDTSRIPTHEWRRESGHSLVMSSVVKPTSKCRVDASWTTDDDARIRPSPGS